MGRAKVIPSSFSMPSPSLATDYTAPILLKKSKFEQRQKSRESRFLADSIAAMLHSADTRVGGRF
jgi:hypothetical protein